MDAFATFRTRMHELVDSLAELHSLANTTAELIEDGVPFDKKIIEELQGKVTNGKAVSARFDAILEETKHCGLFFLSEGQYFSHINTLRS